MHVTIRDRFDAIDHRLARIERLLQIVARQGVETMSTSAEIQAAIDASNAATAAQTSVVQSAVTALNGITQRINDAVAAFQVANPGVDVSSLVAATAAEQANTNDLAAAVAANTPAAPPVPPPAAAP